MNLAPLVLISACSCAEFSFPHFVDVWMIFFLSGSRPQIIIRLAYGNFRLLSLLYIGDAVHVPR